MMVIWSAVWSNETFQLLSVHQQVYYPPSTPSEDPGIAVLHDIHIIDL